MLSVFGPLWGNATAADEDTTNGGGGFSIPGGIELEEGEILPEPDQDVNDICSSAAASDSDITCEEACAKAACCYWTGEDSCYDDFSATCDLWREAGCFEFSV